MVGLFDLTDISSFNGRAINHTALDRPNPPRKKVLNISNRGPSVFLLFRHPFIYGISSNSIEILMNT